jgi:hypothetical protein
MRRAGVRRAGVLAALLAAVAVAAGCGGTSEEDRVRETVAKAAARAEKRDLEGLGRFLDAGFTDGEGRDKAGLLELVSGYLERRRGVVVHVLGCRVLEVDPAGRASVEFEVSLSHGAAEVLRKLIRWSGTYYRFSAGLVRDPAGEWRFAAAAWEEIPLTDLFPESLAVLKELFPDL